MSLLNPAPAPTAPAPPPLVLTALDRCDRCGAQAQTQATLTSGSLLFCGHHRDEHLPALIQAGATVQNTSA